MTLTPEQRARLRELAEELEASRQEYRALVEQHAVASGQKVGYVTRPARLSVALDTYRQSTEPQAILALLNAHDALLARLERVEGALQNIHMAAARGRSFGHQATPQTAERMVERKDEALALVLRLCADAGISSSPLRDAVLDAALNPQEDGNASTR